MKYGNWKGLIWAIAGFALFGYGLDKENILIWLPGAMILGAWLIYVFYSHIRDES